MGRKIRHPHPRTPGDLIMKKILVTGATGFIGNYMIKELLQNNCRVIASSSDKKKAEKQSWFSQVTYIPFNLDSFDDALDYFSIMGSPDALIHLAWEGLPNYRSAHHTGVNLPRHKAFLENMVRNGLKDLTVTGTCFEYGMQEGCLSEEMPAHPDNAYAVAKDELRKALEQMQARKGFILKWVRLFYLYGHGQGPNSLFSQLMNALERGDTVFNMSGGEQVRDFLPVEKMAAYIVKIVLQQKVTGIINCCSGEPVKVKQFVVNLLNEKNRQMELNLGHYPYSDYEPMSFWGDNRKLKSILYQD